MRTLPAELVKGTTCSGGLFETAGLPARNLAAAMAAAIATSNAATAIDTVVRRDRLRHVRASRVPTARIWADSIRRRAARKSTTRSRVPWYRSSGSFARHFSRMRSRSAVAGPIDGGSGGAGSCRIACIVST